MRRSRLFLLNGIILSVVSILMRSITVVFGVYISNKIGADGMGLYSLIMSVNVFAITFATSGVNIAATRLVSEELAKGNLGIPHKVMRYCLLYAVLFGVTSFLLLSLCAGYVGAHWLGDVKTVRSLYVLATAMPFIALASALNGYFLAVRRVIKSASGQILEQLVKMGICIALLGIYAPKGIEYACFAIVLGASLSEVFDFLYLFTLFLFDKRKIISANLPFEKMRLPRISMPVALAAYARSALFSIQQLLIPAGLIKFGLTRTEALSQYGIISGMVLPIVLFPLAFITAFAGLLIPEMTEFQTQNNSLRIRSTIHRVLKAVYLFNSAIAAILFCFGDELGLLLYHSQAAGFYIKLLAPLVIVMYSDTIADGMLKGLNQQAACMRYNLFDSGVSLLLVWLLVPKFGISGYVTGIFAGEILNAVLSLRRLLIVSEYRPAWGQLVLKPFLCAGIATVFTLFIKNLSGTSPQSTVPLCLWICFCGLLYILITLITSEPSDSGYVHRLFS